MQSDWLLPQRKIWVKKDDLFIAAVVTSRNDKLKTIDCQLDKTLDKTTQPFSACYQRSAEGVDYEDMCNMNILNEPEILANLKARYQVNKIYTKIGPTLIALNPYKPIESLYGDEVLLSLKENVKTDSVSDDLSPHVYLTAGAAYLNLKLEGRKQAIVISGESGAGKTENTKYCMKFLTSLSHIHSHHEKQKAIEDIILECNPILQAFGNSKTIRNSNSSRFGKYVRLFISKEQQMTGARIQNYLLEKSRVTSVGKKERSFHIFYYLINSHEREAAGLLPNEKYQYLDISGCMVAEGINDKTDFRILKASLEDVGFSKQDCFKLWTSIASILLLGNLNFDDKQNLVNQNNYCQYADQKLAGRVCKNLGMKLEQLNSLLLEQKLMIGKEAMIKRYDKKQCLTNRNTLAKALYGRIFDFLIEKINNKLWINKKDDRSISILDIFGFEIFDKNSFQQLCINFTNERLQKLYTKYVFDNEIQELKKDDLADKIRDLVPPDNKQIIQLIEKKMGVSVFSLIDQKTSLGSAKDEDIVSELRKMKSQKLYVEPQPNKTMFMILHTQNIVTYHVDGFRYKNQDTITNQIETLLNRLFPIGDNNEFKGKTLVTKFDKQLRALNDELQASQLHFIRCIKPNETKQKDSLDDRFVLQQIKYLGVLQTIQIRKSTYAFRSPFELFNNSYKSLVQTDKAFSKLTQPEQTIFILKRLFPGVQKEKNSFLLGKQRVYLRDDLEKRLNQLALKNHETKANAAAKIQNQFLRARLRSNLIQGLKRYLHRMGKLKKLLTVRLKSIRLKYFRKFRDQAKLATKQLKDKKVLEDRNKADKADKVKQHQANITQQKKNQRVKQLGEIMKKITPVLLIYQRYLFFLKLKITANNDLLYQSVVYDYGTVKQQPQIQKQKPLEPEFKATQLSESYLLHQSVVNESKDVLVKGQLRLPLYERDPKNLAKMRQIICHTNAVSETQNNEFDVIISKDADFQIGPSTVKGQLGHKIVNFQYLQFFQQSLKARKTLFGRKKNPLETMTAKDGPMSRSLIQMQESEEVKAVEIFKLLLTIADPRKTDKVYEPIERIIQLLQNGSGALKNEVFTQILKQQNAKGQYATIKMYQIMAIYLHIFKPQDMFMMGALSIYLERSQEPQIFEKAKEFCHYLFPRLLRKVQQKDVSSVLYLPIQFQLAALMCKRQIPVSVFLSIGNSVIVKVESYEILGDIKERVCEEVGINYKRINKDMFGFFQVMSFENEELEENPLGDDRNVWDLMTYWDRAKNKFEQSKIKSPDFGLYIKVKFAYECSFDDEETIELFYCQSYFDLFIGRFKLPMDLLLECSAIMRAQDPELDAEHLVPLWAIEGMNSKQQYLQGVEEKTKLFLGRSRQQLRFQFIKNCDSSPLCMAIPFPTGCSTKIFLKPKRIYLLQEDRIVEEIGIRKVLRWGSDETTLMLTVKDHNSQRNVTIKTQFARIISNYLSTCMKLIIAMKY